MDLLNAVRERAIAADPTARKAILDQLNSLARELETPQDCMQRLLYQPMTLPIIRAGCDLGLFRRIVDSPAPLSSAQLADECGSDGGDGGDGSKPSPVLLSRLLRYLASIDVVRETAPDRYGSTNTTRTLATREWQSAVLYYCDVFIPSFAALPALLKEQGYQDVDDPADCAFNRAHGTSERIFTWLPTRPSLFADFNRFMSVQRAGMPTWLDVYPYLTTAAARGGGGGPAVPLFVDVGGGVGHQSAALRRALPASVRGRIIVQDQPALLGQALRCEGVEHTAHDFFAPQPVRAARMYYMRNILHDWNDADALRILRCTRLAMGPRSRLLLDEMVMPEAGVHWHAAQLDMLMMAVLAARERTMAQWQQLVRRAGLRLRKVYRYTEYLADSIIECVRDDAPEEEMVGEGGYSASL